MINALVCAYNSGDVIGFALRQLSDAPCVSRILIADGPHKGKTFGYLPAKPTVREAVDRLKSNKVYYEHTTDCKKLGEKCNRVLKHVTSDCQWILVVDSDEVYHEKCLERLSRWLPEAKYGRYSIKSLDPYPDFYHHFEIPDWKPRLFRWYPGAHCALNVDDAHQWVLHGNQHQCPDGDSGGRGRVPREICEFYHLNALRHPGTRLTLKGGGALSWFGGGVRWESKIQPLDASRVPKVIRDLKRKSL